MIGSIERPRIMNVRSRPGSTNRFQTNEESEATRDDPNLWWIDQIALQYAGY